MISLPSTSIQRFSLFFFSIFLVSSVSGRRFDVDSYKGNAQVVSVEDDQLLSLYQSWIDTGVSSIMAVMANRRLKKKRAGVALKFGQCSTKAETIPDHAKCVSRLLRDEIHPEDAGKLAEINRMQRYGKHLDHEWTGAFRTHDRPKRSVKSAAGYDLMSSKSGLTPLGGVAKLLLQTVLEKKNKTHAPAWQETVDRLRLSGAKTKKLKKQIEEDSAESMDQLALRGMRQFMQPKNENGLDNVDVEEMIKDPTQMKRYMEAHKKRKNKKPEDKIVDLVRDGLKLGYTLAGQNTTNFDNKTMKMISPRFFGLVPEEKNQNEVSFLSPSLFSLHDEGTDVENITSIRTLLKDLPIRDQQIWLDLIMEASGINEESDKLERGVDEVESKNKTLNLMNHEKMVDENGVPLYFTKQNVTGMGGDYEKRKIDIFEQLQRNYSKVQLREMNSTGYSFLTHDQLHMVYGPQSPYNSTHDLNRFLNLTEEEMHEHLERDVHAISEVEKFKVRQKDIVLSPFLFASVVLQPGLASQPFILSPVLLSALVLSPSVFGPVVLSPWVFLPVILSPRILGSTILSPFLFDPVILTPLALHPAILSPGAFNPFVLSPLLMTPFILSPQVLTPIILCPFALSPFILNPTAGVPIVLSPFVLSPLIGSPAFLGALVLSPYALSPVLFSPLAAFAVILSPSWLS